VFSSLTPFFVHYTGGPPEHRDAMEAERPTHERSYTSIHGGGHRNEEHASASFTHHQDGANKEGTVVDDVESSVPPTLEKRREEREKEADMRKAKAAERTQWRAGKQKEILTAFRKCG
jgi:hypothetical protein